MRRAAAVAVLSLVLAAPARAVSVPKAIKLVFGGRAKQALCIARAESHLNQFAVSPTDDYGEFQIHSSWFGHVIRYHRRRSRVTRRYIFGAMANARVAFIISKGGTDWRPWSTYSKRGLCRG